MSAFNQYLRTLVAAIRDHNGRELANLWHLNNLAAKEAIFEKHYSRQGWDPHNEVLSNTAGLYESRKEWSEIISGQIQMLRFVCTGESERAFEQAEAVMAPFTKIYREEKDGWMAAAMVCLARNIRLVALAADAVIRKSGKKPVVLENCGSALQKVFATAIGGSNPRKKAPVLEVVVTLFRVYFKLNTLRLCKNLIAAVDGIDFSIFPKSAQVSYMFFVGRLSIFDDKYDEAEQALEYALRHCHRLAVSNKSRILYYLVPVKLVLGQLPSQQALQKYRLEDYAEIVEAMRSGNVSQLDQSLEANQWHFIQSGTYLLLEKLRQAVARRLLKKVYLLKAENGNQLHLLHFQKALEWQNVILTMDEVECLVANLIYRNYVKGYIAHSRRILVCSKVTPFPPLKSANVSDIL